MKSHHWRLLFLEFFIITRSHWVTIIHTCAAYRRSFGLQLTGPWAQGYIIGRPRMTGHGTGHGLGSLELCTRDRTHGVPKDNVSLNEIFFSPIAAAAVSAPVMRVIERPERLCTPALIGPIPLCCTNMTVEVGNLGSHCRRSGELGSLQSYQLGNLRSLPVIGQVRVRRSSGNRAFQRRHVCNN